MNFLWYGICRFLQFVFPPTVARRVAGSPVLRKPRDLLIRPHGDPWIVQGKVVWEALHFLFAAPPRVLHRAQKRGIENRLCRLARAVLKEGDTAVEVGGNYGFVAVMLG